MDTHRDSIRRAVRSPIPFGGMVLRAMSIVSVITLLGGCDFGGHHQGETRAWAHLEDDGVPAIDPRTARGVVILVNDPLTDERFLDDDVELDVRAAERIVGHRRGPDGIDGTADDDRFDDIPELVEVAWVGDDALVRLGAVAWELDLVPVIAVEGVEFTAGELEDTLLLANIASEEELDLDVGLDARAARAIFHGRPYDSLVELSERPWVGSSALVAMRRYSEAWLMEQGGTE